MHRVKVSWKFNQINMSVCVCMYIIFKWIHLWLRLCLCLCLSFHSFERAIQHILDTCVWRLKTIFSPIKEEHAPAHVCARACGLILYTVHEVSSNEVAKKRHDSVSEKERKKAHDTKKNYNWSRNVCEKCRKTCTRVIFSFRTSWKSDIYLHDCIKQTE